MMVLGSKQFLPSNTFNFQRFNFSCVVAKLPGYTLMFIIIGLEHFLFVMKVRLYFMKGVDFLYIFQEHVVCSLRFEVADNGFSSSSTSLISRWMILRKIYV